MKMVPTFRRNVSFRFRYFWNFGKFPPHPWRRISEDNNLHTDLRGNSKSHVYKFVLPVVEQRWIAPARLLLLEEVTHYCQYSDIWAFTLVGETRMSGEFLWGNLSWNVRVDNEDWDVGAGLRECREIEWSSSWVMVTGGVLKVGLCCTELARCTQLRSFGRVQCLQGRTLLRTVDDCTSRHGVTSQKTGSIANTAAITSSHSRGTCSLAE